MNTLVYQSLRNISWNCDICGFPNLSSHIFDTSTITSVNSNDTFIDVSFNLDSFRSPTATSSPMQKARSNTYTKKPRSDTPTIILIVNCQSIKNKKQEQDNLVETSKPDSMIGTESWLSNNMQSTEIFPSGFTPCRKERKTDSHDCVFIPVSDKYLSSELTDLKQTTQANNYG
jgi:hypothetical protein